MNPVLRQQIESLETVAYDRLKKIYVTALSLKLRGEDPEPAWEKFRKVFMRTFILANLLGRSDVVASSRIKVLSQNTGGPGGEKFEEPLAYAEPSGLITGPFMEALAWFDNKVPQLSSVVANLGQQARQRAFYITGVEDQKALEAIKAKLGKSLQAMPGEGSAAFIKAFKQDSALALTEARLETIYRTNLMSALNAGRREQLSSPEISPAVPLLMLVEILDRRTRGNPGGLYPDAPPHWQMNGFIERANHLVWERITPPNGFNCRGRVAAVPWMEAQRMGLATKDRQLKPEALTRHNGKRWEFINRGMYPDPGFNSAPLQGAA